MKGQHRYHPPLEYVNGGHRMADLPRRAPSPQNGSPMSKAKSQKSNSSASLKKGDHLYLVDGSTFIFRAYHALPPLTRKSDGLPVGAVSGFANMLHKLIEDLRGDDQPTHLAVIFDYSGKTFRNKIYPEYKAHRPPAPEDLVPQFEIVRAATRAFGVPALEMEGFEGDDLIATYATQASAAGAEVTIVSSDKDLMQLIDDRIEMFDTMKNRRIGVDGVVEKFGVGPDKVIEVQALSGDSVDNVPGVPGIGIKTAALLINEYGDLENLLAHAGEIKQTKRRENLIEFADQARISKELVTLKCDVDVDVPITDLELHDPNPKPLIAFLKAMEFGTLTKRVAAEHKIEDIEAIAPDESLIAGDRQARADTKAANSKAADGKTKTSDKSTKAKGGAPGAIADKGEIARKFDPDAYETVTTEDALDVWIARAFEAGIVAVDTETTSLDTMAAKLVGVSLAVVPGEACYVPLGHGSGDGLAFDDVPDQIDLKVALKKLKPLLEAPGVLKVAQNLKYDFEVLARHGIRIAPFDDTMLLSYVLDAGLHGHGMDELSKTHLDHAPIPFTEIAGKGKAQKTFDEIPIPEATRYAAEDADVTLRLWRLLKPRLASEGMATVYETLERPLVPILADMEMEGVVVDRQVLSRLSGEFGTRMVSLEKEAHKLAGEEFNLGSPKQLGEILFDKLGTGSTKKTKTGAYSTGADVLEDLAAQGHELPQVVLSWRQLSKLRGTYTDALPTFINQETGRVHTSYSLAATTTGRLASSDPNLQNIPIRTKEGRQIRTAFIADKGNKLLSADYSQIELRVLAHVADIKQLKKAFEDGLDIHAMTASEMFGVPIKDMDPAVRRRAKAINFGIIYGISAFGLANQLSIPRGEAQDYIKTYFERFPGIRDYMNDTIAFCRTHEFVETVFGRRCHYPRINSKNPAEKSFNERAAINAPIQGSAADIIRRAMIRMPEALRKAKLKATMLLQVHDELIFEVPEAQIKDTTKVVRQVMEHATEPALELSVPLIVDAKAADTWDEAH